MTRFELPHGKYALVAILGLAPIGCTPMTPRPREQAAIVIAESDPGVPLGGVAVLVGDRKVAQTDAKGRAKVIVHGLHGDVFPLAVVCPEGHRATRSAEFSVIVRGESGESLPEFRAQCTRAQRHAMVVVKAGAGKDLPVLYLGRTVARTDASGTASFSLDVSPGEEVELTLDTTEAKKLLPRNPTVSFKAPDRDEPVVLEQRFTAEAPPRRRVVVQKPVGPRRLGDG